MSIIKNLKFAVLVFICGLVLFACASVSRHEQLLSAALSTSPLKSDGTCTDAIFVVEKYPVASAGLSPESIAIFDWNIYKGSLEGWDSDFLRLSDGIDIVLLQEASLDERMEAVLQQQNLHWSLNNAFFYQGNETGVLLASAVPPIANCGQRTREPIIGIPKTILIARYAIKNSEKELLVANIHGINITLGTGSYQKQFDELETILRKHDGPLIVAGDFNNWSDARTTIMMNLANRLFLQKIAFADELRTTFLGGPVDQILYRGLNPLNSQVHLVDSSDHRPISVRFRLAGYETALSNI